MIIAINDNSRLIFTKKLK